MCGINGIYSINEISNLKKRVSKMNLSIEHRGPDSDGYYENENIALGFRRLSIIDIREVSNQPFHSNNKEWHLVFNGEIYNFEEIKEGLNYNFSTNSDTEVIIASFQEKGIDWFLERANGMFAIAAYNSTTKDFYLIRDRLGIKPLYYYNDGKKLVFSSEIKAILASGLVEAEFNTHAVDEYLANRYVREPFTFFKNIYQVKPGELHKINEDLTFESLEYWDIPTKFNIETEFNESEIVDKLDKELTKAIKYRLIADVPLGTYLSGGVDSSLITAITAINKKEKVNTYTIGFENLNEFEYANLIVDKYKTNHHEILMKKEDYLNNWERLIKFKDAPLGVPNEIPLAIMSSKLKEKITVVLSGEGADELLGGYGRVFRLPFDYSNSSKEKSFYNTFIDQYEYVSRSMRDALLNTKKPYRDLFDNDIKKEFSSRTNEASIFYFFHKYHVKGLLQRVDMTTMQTSVEARVPFLDHNLIEYSYKEIPYNLKLKWINNNLKEKAKTKTSKDYSEVYDIPKYALRKLGYNYLPKEIIERKKVGFPVPLTDWFDNLEELANKLLLNSNWLKKGVVQELILKSKLENRAGQILWMFINIELFKKKYFNKKWTW